VPDLTSVLVRSSSDADEVWAEWDWSGREDGGGRFHRRGVTILGIEGDEIAWARFYMEPVDP
jgi:hypothetical protein